MIPRIIPIIIAIFFVTVNALQGGRLKSSLPLTSSQRSAAFVEQLQFAEIEAPFDAIDDFIVETIPTSAIYPPKNEQSPPALSEELWEEGLGTFLIVGVGSMASMAASFADPFSATPLCEIALVWSSAVSLAINMCHNGQAHFNPAMTFASALFRGFDWKKVVPYSLAQLVGSTTGSAASYAVYHEDIARFEEHQDIVRVSSIDTARVFGEYFDSSLSIAQAFGVEAFGTAVLAFTAFLITHPSREQTKMPVSLIMGGTVFSLINLLAPLTQAGMNPARDFGPRIVAYAAGWTDVAFQNCWLYILAPMIGATVGAALVDKVWLADEKS